MREGGALTHDNRTLHTDGPSRPGKPAPGTGRADSPDKASHVEGLGSWLVRGEPCEPPTTRHGHSKLHDKHAKHRKKQPRIRVAKVY